MAEDASLYDADRLGAVKKLSTPRKCAHIEQINGSKKSRKMF